MAAGRNGRTRKPVFVAAWVLWIAALQAGCLSPESRHRVLVLLFDEPPPFGDLAETEKTVEKLDVRTPTDQSFHGPYLQGKCDICHASGFFGSTEGVERRLSVAKEELCTRCHYPKEQFKGEYRHGPADAGQCFMCHDPHRSKLPHLLRASGYDLCGRCHTQETVAIMDQHRQENGDDCVRCHDPHAADKPKLLR